MKMCRFSVLRRAEPEDQENESTVISDEIPPNIKNEETPVRRGGKPNACNSLGNNKMTLEK